MRIPASTASVLRDQKGVALPVSLFALILTSLLIAAMLVTSSMELAIGSAHRDATTGRYNLEGAVEWYVAEMGMGLQPGTVVANVAGENITFTTARLREVTPDDPMRIYSIVAQQANGRREVGAFVRVPFGTNTFNGLINAAATFGGDVEISGNIKITGNQNLQLCASGTQSGQAVTHSSDSQVSLKGSADLSGSGGTGMNAVTQDVDTRQNLALKVLGGLTPREMAEKASIKFGPLFSQPNLASNAEPLSTKPANDKYNWGCPLGMDSVKVQGVLYEKCTTSSAITNVVVTVPPNEQRIVAIDANGGLVQLSKGEGQGILLVLRGHLKITGQFLYKGIIIVEGNTYMQGMGNHVQGALIGIGQVELKEGLLEDADDSKLTGTALVQFNSCAVAAAQDAFNNIPSTPTQRAPAGNIFGWFTPVR